MSAAVSLGPARGAIMPHATHRRGRHSEDRVVKRGPPRSRLHRVAPSPSVPGPSSPDGGAARDATSRERARGASLGTRAVERTASKGVGRAVAAPGNDEARVLESGVFGVQTSVERI